MREASPELASTAQAEVRTCTAFEGYRRLASGPLAEVVRQTKQVLRRGETAPVLIFDDATSEPIEVDWRGTTREVLGRLATRGKPTPAPATAATEVEADGGTEGRRGPGRPRLGVVAREVTLLPRHWDWLQEQPGGASVALRKLVDEARHARQWADRARASSEAVHRFMFALAGSLADFEEVSRAFYAGDAPRLRALVKPWPRDVRDHLLRLAEVAFRDAAEAREHEATGRPG